MRIFVERRTKSGEVTFERLDRVEKVVFLDDEKAVFQVDKDFKKSKAKRGQDE